MKLYIYAIISLAITFSFASEFTNNKQDKILKGLKKFNKNPHYVNPRIAFMCSMPKINRWEAHKDKYGPHDISIDIYLNDISMKNIKEKKNFSEGAIILKKQQTRNKDFPKIIGGMKKMHQKYDPKNENWLYFTLSQKGKYNEGKMLSCINCHKNAKGYVYKNWLSK